jgi:multiple sugar transport system substrate-binding protein
MRRGVVVLLLLAVGVGVAGTAKFGGSAKASSSSAKVTKLKVWVGWSSRELSVFKKIVAEYDKKHPEVQISVVGGIDDTKIVSAIRGGNAADVTSSFDSTNVGNYCTSGAWLNLKPFLDKDKISLGLFPKTSVYYTSYKGVQCALPLLADTWGLYYNTALFKKAGLTKPPKTMDELTRYAKKLTQKNADGSLKVVGYNPSRTFYAENSAVNYGHLFGAKWLTADGKSNLSKDPGWAKYLRWSKNLIDFYGADKLKRWQARVGDEFSSSNAFETGKLAMQIDGEWRVAFIAAEHPELKYATAPMPVDAAHKDLYGSNNVNGTIIGIPKTTKHKEEAWALVKYLTTNSHPLAQFSNGIRNVPTTKASLRSKEIKPDKHFATFLKIFGNPHSDTSPIVASGASYTNLVANFMTKWQAGKVANLDAVLAKLDQQLDAQVKQAGGGGVP